MLILATSFEDQQEILQNSNEKALHAQAINNVS